MTPDSPDHHTPMTGAADVRRRLSRRPRHRARDHGRRQPGARPARTRARLRRRGAPSALRHRGAHPFGPPPPDRDPPGDLERRRRPRRRRRRPGARGPPGRARPRRPCDARPRRHGRGDHLRAAARRGGGLDARARVRHGAQPLRPPHVGGRDRGLDGARRPACRASIPASTWSTCRCPRRSAASTAGSVGVLAAEGVLGDAVAEAPRLGGRRRLVASAQLSPTGPSLFGPAQGTASDLAGHGVADPSPMLLATALLLSEGLGRAAAGEALEESLTAALQRVAAPVRGLGPRRRRDHARVRRRGARPAAERPSRHRVRAGGGAMKMTGGDAILRSLEAEGVEVMFGIPGGAIMPTYDAMARGTTVRHVLARHEQGAGHMAQGYARASGRVGVAIATSGPGATNLVTPIADAWMDSTPLVCITGQVRSSLIGTDALPGVRHHRDHDADRQALVARAGRRGRSRPC